MSDRIRFCGFTDRPLQVFAGATATVLSSRFEGFRSYWNEAMGVGTPFIRLIDRTGFAGVCSMA